VSLLNALSSQLLRSPLLWGSALAFAFFALVHGGLVADATVVRYLAGHWVEYVEVHLFCIGLAALAQKALAVVRESSRGCATRSTTSPARARPMNSSRTSSTCPTSMRPAPRRATASCGSWSGPFRSWASWGR